MRISDWSSDVCSSDLVAARLLAERGAAVRVAALGEPATDLAQAARAGWSGPVERLDGRLAPALPVPLIGAVEHAASGGAAAAFVDRVLARGAAVLVDPPVDRTSDVSGTRGAGVLTTGGCRNKKKTQFIR